MLLPLMLQRGGGNMFLVELSVARGGAGLARRCCKTWKAVQPVAQVETPLNASECRYNTLPTRTTLGAPECTKGLSLSLPR